MPKKTKKRRAYKRVEPERPRMIKRHDIWVLVIIILLILIYFMMKVST